MYWGSLELSPNDTVSSTGPISNVTSPRNFGPLMWICAPMWIEIVMVANQRSMVMPAEMLAYTLASSQNGSKNTITSAPNTTCAQAGPSSADASSLPPAINASDVRAK